MKCSRNKFGEVGELWHTTETISTFFKNVEYAVFEIYLANKKYPASDYNKDTWKSPTSNFQLKADWYLYNICSI